MIMWLVPQMMSIWISKSAQYVPEIGPEIPADKYVGLYDAETVKMLGIYADQAREAKLITFPHGETYELWDTVKKDNIGYGLFITFC